MPESEFGRIKLFEDFTGPEWIVAETAASGAIGDFRVIGASIAETDSGITVDEDTVPLNGVGILTTAGDDKTCCGLATSKSFEIGKMAPFVAELRIQFTDDNTKIFAFGITNENADGVDVEDDIISVSTNTLTVSADDFVGFWFDSETTNYTTSWHGVYKGGTIAAPTLSTEVDFPNNLIVEGEWQILRLEIDPNGTARWFIDGILLQTIEGACSTTEDLAVVALLSDHNAAEFCKVDYFAVRANRDWTV